MKPDDHTGSAGGEHDDACVHPFGLLGGLSPNPLPFAYAEMLPHSVACFCGKPTMWRIRYGRYLAPAVCWRCMGPEERGLVALRFQDIMFSLEWR